VEPPANKPQTHTPQQISERCAAIMWPGDRAPQALGIEHVRVAPGEAVVRMTVRPDMTNGHGTCHGGFIFTLADTAFAYACNTFNARTVAAGADIDFIAPAHSGEMLTAHAQARHQGGRSGLYDIEVRSAADALVAVFRGRATRVRGHFFEAG
jgi:acyl-CoA thioesterase